MNEKNDTKSHAIRIKSVQANSLFLRNNFSTNDVDKKNFLDTGKAVLNDSIFTRYMRKHGVTVDKTGRSRDFVVMKFDYGIKKSEHCESEMSAKQLREHFYINGATITWYKTNDEGKVIYNYDPIHYKMLMRSSGKAKDGDCIFIKDKLYDIALKYITMDLWNRMPYNNAKIVEMSAYAPLITATALDFIKIPMKNIFIIKDENVKSGRKVIAVKTTDNEYQLEVNNINECAKKKSSKIYPECYVDRSDVNIKAENTLWDGMGLVDDSIFPETKKMEGFIYCRSHFFKSCLFRGNIQKYFKDYYGEDYEKAELEDMFGNKIKVKDIKVIITENSIKWIKFKDIMGCNDLEAYEYYKKFMEANDETFSIVKTAHKSKWGDFQRSSYQINNSYPCIKKDVLERIAKDSIEYCNNLKTNHEAFMKHLAITGSKRYSFNNVLIALDEWNDKFKYTPFFKNKKNSIISEFKRERLKLGKLLQYGDNLTICGNPVALLMKVTGQDFLSDPCFELIDDGIQCYTTRFQDGEKLAGFRSPHNAPNNIVHLVNTYSKPLEEYFPDLGDNVIVINGIYTDVQDRLNGQDLDTDSIFTTNHPDIVQIARDSYLNYPTIINKIGLKGNSEYNKDMESYAKMDYTISASQNATGLASNKAQLALSYYYDSGSSSTELEDIFIICSVLAQVAIDNAKRESVINVNRELWRISQKPCMNPADGKKYPKFYAEVQKTEKDNIIPDKQIRKFNCPMEILADIIEEGVIDRRKDKGKSGTKPLIYNFRAVFEYVPNRKCDNKQYKKVKSIITEYDKRVKALDRTKEDYSENIGREFEDCIKRLEKIKINPVTMAFLVAYAFSPECKITERILTVLYDKNKETFLNCFKKSKSPAKSSESLIN